MPKMINRTCFALVFFLLFCHNIFYTYISNACLEKVSIKVFLCLLQPCVSSNRIDSLNNQTSCNGIETLPSTDFNRYVSLFYCIMDPSGFINLARGSLLERLIKNAVGTCGWFIRLVIYKCTCCSYPHSTDGR